MGRELEWKYRADPEKIAAVMGKFMGFSPIEMETSYYDTPDLKLSMHQWTLRRRLENGLSVCSFKRPLDDGSRGEWEVACPNIMEAVMKLCQQGADWELMRAASGGLIQLCGAKFTRQAAVLTLESCTVELALDQGILTGRNRELPLAEIEIEYKSGSEDAARAFAEALAQEFSLTEEPKSKFARALALSFA